MEINGIRAGLRNTKSKVSKSEWLADLALEFFLLPVATYRLSLGGAQEHLSLGTAINVSKIQKSAHA